MKEKKHIEDNIKITEDNINITKIDIFIPEENRKINRVNL